jgi:hypothetical protein
MGEVCPTRHDVPVNDHHPARRLWHAIEPVHAVTYFDTGCREAAASAGMQGFWMGYFALRSAPMGPVGPDVVEPIFAGFRPAMVARALPDAWGHLSPPECLAVRVSSSADALRRAAAAAGIDVLEVEAIAADACRSLEPVLPGLSMTGRPLAAANRALPLPDDPVERLWQVTTVLREHRGDGHVAAVVAAGLSGLDAHLLQVAAGESKWGSRGWTDEERADEEAVLRDGGLLDGSGTLTADGVAVRDEIEERTDRASWAGGLRALGEDGVDAVTARLAPLVAAAQAVLWFPNPIGLPGPGEGGGAVSDR